MRCHNRVSASRTCVAPLSGLPDGGLSTLWCSQPFRLFASSTSSILTSPKDCFGQCHADRHTRTPQFLTGRVEITGYRSRRWWNCEWNLFSSVPCRRCGASQKSFHLQCLFLSRPVARIHVSQPDSKMGATRDLFLASMLKLLLSHILFNLAIAAVAAVIPAAVSGPDGW